MCRYQGKADGFNPTRGSGPEGGSAHYTAKWLICQRKCKQMQQGGPGRPKTLMHPQLSVLCFLSIGRVNAEELALLKPRKACFPGVTGLAVCMVQSMGKLCMRRMAIGYFCWIFSR